MTMDGIEPWIPTIMLILAIVGSSLGTVYFMNKQMNDFRRELSSSMQRVEDKLSEKIGHVERKADKANDFHIQIIDRLSKLKGKVDCIIENNE